MVVCKWEQMHVRVCMCVCMRVSRTCEGINIGLQFLFDLLVLVLAMLLLDGVEVGKQFLKVNVAGQVVWLGLAVGVFEEVGAGHAVKAVVQHGEGLCLGQQHQQAIQGLHQSRVSNRVQQL